MSPKRKRVFHASDGFDAVELLKYARGHLESARVLFAKGYHCFDSAAFLAHLAFELLAKALLLSKTGRFPVGHSLPALWLALKQKGVTLKLSRRGQKGFILLNRFENARYPHPVAGVEVGDEDMPFFAELWDEIILQMDPELREAFRNADPLTKGGRILMYKPGNSPLHRAT